MAAYPGLSVKGITTLPYTGSVSQLLSAQRQQNLKGFVPNIASATDNTPGSTRHKWDTSQKVIHVDALYKAAPFPRVACKHASWEAGWPKPILNQF